MINWTDVIDNNWNACVNALDAGAKEVLNSYGSSVYRVELNADGSISSYWTDPSTTSAEVYYGDSIVLDEFGGYGWDYDEESYDPDLYDADARLEYVRDYMSYYGA